MALECCKACLLHMRCLSSGVVASLGSMPRCIVCGRFTHDEDVSPRKRYLPIAGTENGIPCAGLWYTLHYMLRVMRMVQQEQDLRARTRALEQFRRSTESEKSAPQAKP